MKISTVLGTIDSSELGITLMHEHVLIANHTLRIAYPKWFERDVFIQYAVRMLKNAKESGIDTIVDATPIDLGRDLSIMQEVSEKSGVHIIPCTGFYWSPQVSLQDKSPEFISEILINDIENGIEGSDIKAQFIKFATVGPELTEYDRKIGKAAALASNATGVFIYTHTNQKNGISQIDFFESEGVSPERVVIGHMGDTEDYEYIRSIMDRGHYIGMDRFSSHVLEPENYLEDEKRAKVVAELIKEGYGKGMVISQDVACFLDYTGFQNVGNRFPVVMSQDLDDYKVQFNYIPKYVYKMFQDCGMTERDIERLMADNPRDIFEGKSCRVGDYA